MTLDTSGFSEDGGLISACTILHRRTYQNWVRPEDMIGVDRFKVCENRVTKLCYFVWKEGGGGNTKHIKSQNPVLSSHSLLPPVFRQRLKAKYFHFFHCYPSNYPSVCSLRIRLPGKFAICFVLFHLKSVLFTRLRFFFLENSQPRGVGGIDLYNSVCWCAVGVSARSIVHGSGRQRLRTALL